MTEPKNPIQLFIEGVIEVCKGEPLRSVLAPGTLEHAAVKAQQDWAYFCPGLDVELEFFQGRWTLIVSRREGARLNG